MDNDHKNTTIEEYGYDKKGNLTKGLNKVILSVSYNPLNLPVSVNKTIGNCVECIYNAEGTKRRQLYYVSGNINHATDFIAK